MRHLASELDLAGSSATERAAVDSLYCLWFSTMRNNGVSHSGEHYSVAALKKADAVSLESVPPYEEIFRVNDLSVAERSIAILRFFGKTLNNNGDSSFLVGATPTYVDFGLFYTLFELAEEDNVPDFCKRFNLPCLGVFLEVIAERPRISGEEYCSEDELSHNDVLSHRGCPDLVPLLRVNLRSSGM